LAGAPRRTGGGAVIREKSGKIHAG